MNKNERLDYHQKFKELAALSHRGALNDSERLDLERHLQVCGSCQEAYNEYALISAEGIPFLAAAYGYNRDGEEWDNRSVRKKLFARIQETERPVPPVTRAKVLRMDGAALRGKMTARLSLGAIAACALLLVGLLGYRMGGHQRVVPDPSLSASSAHGQDLAFEKKAADELITLRNAQLSRLEAQVGSDQQDISRLRDALHAAEARSAALAATKSAKDEQFRQVSEQRDKLVVQLRDAEESYQLVQAQLTSLRAEHDRSLLRTTSLESKVDELTTLSREQERRLKDSDQYLASDRDIRELMGARKLYIADVFDVDSGSRTLKPFGRVFYTQSKSLIFYAFDLDRQPGVKNASAFQVWGKRDTESGEKHRAMNLGILYMDSESNRRWVLRLDDPKQLAEIDAVFVTVEPHGGSQKPTGKPFLYALLRKEANHP
jgi:hypothetical protein